jgi:RNA polymerase sigma-70 factor, ECF subfamily
VDKVERAELQRQLVRLADGEREAFHPAFVVLWPLLKRFAARHLAMADAEDAAQQALLKVFFHAARFDRSRDAVAWALGIAAHEIQSIRRKRRREQPGDEAVAAGPTDDSPGPEEAAAARELELALRGALQVVKPSDAETLIAFAHGERPSEVPAATFRKRLQRALERLRRVWRDQHGGQ